MIFALLQGPAKSPPGLKLDQYQRTPADLRQCAAGIVIPGAGDLRNWEDRIPIDAPADAMDNLAAK